MLTGMLIFFRDGTDVQIVAASLISISFLVVYGAFAPFLDESADKLATFSQLVTFLTLFAAIIVSTGAVQREVPPVVITLIMVFLNISVVLYNVMAEMLEEGVDTVHLAAECNVCNREVEHDEEFAEEHHRQQIDALSTTMRLPGFLHAQVLTELIEIEKETLDIHLEQIASPGPQGPQGATADSEEEPSAPPPLRPTLRRLSSRTLSTSDGFRDLR